MKKREEANCRLPDSRQPRFPPEEIEAMELIIAYNIGADGELECVECPYYREQVDASFGHCKWECNRSIVDEIKFVRKMIGGVDETLH